MSELPFITAILTVPGFSSRPDQTVAASSQSGNTLSVGLVLDNERVAWGVCPFVPDSSFDIDKARNTIQQCVAPVLQEEPLANFRELAEKIDTLTEPVKIRDTRLHLERDGEAGKFSRRDLFTGRLWSADPAPPAREVTIQQPVAAAICYGTSHALLAAVALTQNKTIAQTIAAEYSLPKPGSAVATHVWLQPSDEVATRAVDGLLSQQIASLGYTIAGNDDKAHLGGGGERLQQQVRRLQTQIATATTPAYQPVIHLNLNGGFGRLFDNNPGKILGALYGLGQAAGPFTVRVVDPVITDSREAQVEILRQLKGYLRMRRMRLQLVAGAWVDSGDDANAFIQAEAVHGIQLNAPRLGSLHHSVEAILACRERGITSVLSGAGADDSLSVQVLAQVALAARPDVVIAPAGASGLALLHDEMARTLAWLGQ